jgi:ribosomal protein S18 acetylase RimI-like enzyme
MLCREVTGDRGVSTTIRPMEEEDLPAVSALLRRCYRWLAGPEGYAPAQVEFLVTERGSAETARRESREQTWLVACEDGGVCGLVAVAGNEVARLYVGPDRHRRGIGASLLAAAEAVVARAGHDTMSLGTTPLTAPFYERLGMTVAGRRPHATGVFAGRETVLMEKALPGIS